MICERAFKTRSSIKISIIKAAGGVMETRPSMKLRTERAFYNCGVNCSQTEGQPAGISGDDAGECSK